MIAVTCSACRLRFETQAAPQGGVADAVVCPACDAGEPIVLDFANVRPTRSPKRLKVAAPSMDPFFPAETAPDVPRVTEADGAAPLPVYVDFEAPVAEKSFSFAGPVASIFCLTLLAAGMTWQTGSISASDIKQTFDRIAGRVAPVEPAEVEVAAIADDASLVTGSIARPVSPDLRIEKVATELAETDDGRVLTVRTDILNSGPNAQPAPVLRVSIRGNDGTVLHRWRTSPENASIDPGETRAFLATTMRIPADAGDVKVDFATR